MLHKVPMVTVILPMNPVNAVATECCCLPTAPGQRSTTGGALSDCDPASLRRKVSSLLQQVPQVTVILPMNPVNPAVDTELCCLPPATLCSIEVP